VLSLRQLGYEKFSTTHTRPRSSNVKAIGCVIAGSAANTVALNSGGSFIEAAASSARIAFSEVATSPEPRPDPRCAEVPTAALGAARSCATAANEKHDAKTNKKINRME
jgi:hypothetical protein